MRWPRRSAQLDLRWSLVNAPTMASSVRWGIACPVSKPSLCCCRPLLCNLGHTLCGRLEYSRARRDLGHYAVLPAGIFPRLSRSRPLHHAADCALATLARMPKIRRAARSSGLRGLVAIPLRVLNLSLCDYTLRRGINCRTRRREANWPKSEKERRGSCWLRLKHIALRLPRAFSAKRTGDARAVVASPCTQRRGTTSRGH